jgi:acetate kinase
MSNILTVNPGSTAVKYVLFSGDGSKLDSRVFDRKEHSSVMNTEIDWLRDLPDIGGVSIRIVHGGDLQGPIEWSREVENEIRKFARFAPLHNNMALDVLSAIRELWTGVSIVASFDTDFHKTMPAKARTYPIKTSIAEQYNIKRYGFHGLVIESVLSQLVKEPNFGGQLPNKVICAHIGGGTSVTAVSDGKSVDTTMGLTPLEGLMMITRSGSVDPSLVPHLSELSGESVDSVVQMLNDESGFYGLTGSKNTLDIINRASKRQQPEKLALDIFLNKILKQIFAYYGTLQGCDALVLSGGIGYGNAYLRSRLLDKLKIIGIEEENTYVYQADEARVLFENIGKL